MPNESTNGHLHAFKAFREWGTFLLSCFTALAIPGGLLILKNQRMEIEQEISASYVNKSAYIEDRARADSIRMDQAKSIGEIQGKLNSVFLEQVRMSDNISLLKDQITTRKMP